MSSNKEPEIRFQYFVTAEGAYVHASTESPYKSHRQGYIQDHCFFVLIQWQKGVFEGKSSLRTPQPDKLLGLDDRNAFRFKLDKAYCRGASNQV